MNEAATLQARARAVVAWVGVLLLAACTPDSSTQHAAPDATLRHNDASAATAAADPGHADPANSDPAGSDPASSGPAGSDPGHVDSMPFVQAALEAFRRGLPPIDSLSYASPSRDALVRRLVDALERTDTAAFAYMVPTRQEFAWLYYPHTRYTRRPYDLPADVVWLQLQNRSSRGLTRLLGRYGGVALPGLSYECPEPAEVEGPNRFWHGCVLVREIAAGDTVRERAFGSIWELNRRFKFVSYSNEY